MVDTMQLPLHFSSPPMTLPFPPETFSSWEKLNIAKIIIMVRINKQYIDSVKEAAALSLQELIRAINDWTFCGVTNSYELPKEKGKSLDSTTLTMTLTAPPLNLLQWQWKTEEASQIFFTTGQSKLWYSRWRPAGTHHLILAMVDTELIGVEV